MTHTLRKLRNNVALVARKSPLAIRRLDRETGKLTVTEERTIINNFKQLRKLASGAPRRYQPGLRK